MRAPKWVQRRFDPAARYGLRVTLFALATLVALGPFLYLLLQVTSEGPLTRTDTEVAESLHSVAEDSPGLVAAAKVVSFLGVPAWFYVIIGAAALYFWRKSRRRIATYLVVTNLVGGVLDTIVKLAVNRPRPELEGPSVEAFGKSFPSGHTMAATVGYGTLLLVFMPLIPRRWRVPAVVTYFVWVTLMGLSTEPFPPKNEIDFQDTSSFWLVRLALGSIRARKNKREMGTHARTADSDRFIQWACPVGDHGDGTGCCGCSEVLRCEGDQGRNVGSRQDKRDTRARCHQRTGWRRHYYWSRW